MCTCPCVSLYRLLVLVHTLGKCLAFGWFTADNKGPYLFWFKGSEIVEACMQLNLSQQTRCVLSGGDLAGTEAIHSFFGSQVDKLRLMLG